MRIAAAPLVLAAACMTSPTTDSGVSAPDAPVTFTGFAYQPGAAVEIKVLNRSTGVHEIVATTRATTSPTTLGGATLYYWQTSAILYDATQPATACRFTPSCQLVGVGEVLVRAHERGVGDLVTFDASGLDCVYDKLNAGHGWLDSGQACASADSPNVRLVYELAPRQRVTADVSSTGAPAAWSRTRGAGVRVAILGTGIDFAHPDLPAPVASRSFIGTPTAQDGHGTGTMTTGLIAALDNDHGMIGVAPAAELLIAKVLNDLGVGSAAPIAAGIDWAIANGADIILCGFTSTTDIAEIRAAIGRAANAGVVVLAPVAFGISPPQAYPAAYDSVIGVGAVDANGVRYWASGTGAQVSLVARGKDVRSTALVRTGMDARATWGGVDHETLPLGTTRGVVAGTVYACGRGTGTGSDVCPPAVEGNVALIRRGQTSLFDKVAYAASVGARGVIIANNVPGPLTATTGSTAVVAVTISQADGDALFAGAGTTAVELSVHASDYAALTGTLPAAALATGVAALVMADGAVDVRAALESAALDLGAPGFDPEYGFGSVQVP
jgi:hypothetical protein